LKLIFFSIIFKDDALATKSDIPTTSKNAEIAINERHSTNNLGAEIEAIKSRIKIKHIIIDLSCVNMIDNQAINAIKKVQLIEFLELLALRIFKILIIFSNI
jgi:hypothetical protein